MKKFMCKAPGHDGPRDRGMVVLYEGEFYLELGCTICRDNKILSTQVVSRPKAWERARWINETKGIQRAKDVQRTLMGRVKYFH